MVRRRQHVGERPGLLELFHEGVEVRRGYTEPQSSNPADDLVFKYGVDAPTLRIDGLTIAGR